MPSTPFALALAQNGALTALRLQVTPLNPQRASECGTDRKEGWELQALALVNCLIGGGAQPAPARSLENNTSLGTSRLVHPRPGSSGTYILSGPALFSFGGNTLVSLHLPVNRGMLGIPRSWIGEFKCSLPAHQLRKHGDSRLGSRRPIRALFARRTATYRLASAAWRTTSKPRSH